VLHWQSPHFFAWFAGNTSAPSILAEMLIGSLNMIGFSWQSSPISTELEMVSKDCYFAVHLVLGVFYASRLLRVMAEQHHQHRAGDDEWYFSQRPRFLCLWVCSALGVCCLLRQRSSISTELEMLTNFW
jgi:hypothetical protein